MDIDEKISRTRLTADERAALRIVKDGGEPSPAFGHVRYVAALMTLEQKGLVRCAWVEGHKDVDTARLTLAGDYLLTVNPSLRQPVVWQIVEVLLAIIKRLIVIIALAVLLAHYKLV